MLIETDSPYLAPIPRIAASANEPLFVKEVARQIGELRGFKRPTRLVLIRRRIFTDSWAGLSTMLTSDNRDYRDLSCHMALSPILVFADGASSVTLWSTCWVLDRCGSE